MYIMTNVAKRDCQIIREQIICPQTSYAQDPGCRNHLGKECTGCGWTHGAFLQGNMATFRATNKTKYLDYAMWWGEQQNWITCNYPKVLTEHAAANDMSCGQTYAEVYMHYAEQGHKNDTYIANIRDKVLKVIVERNQIDDWWWDDAFFMAMGTFARIGHISGSRDFHDKNFALYNDSATRRGLWSAANSLYFRDETYKNKTAPNGSPHVSHPIVTPSHLPPSLKIWTMFASPLHSRAVYDN